MIAGPHPSRIASVTVALDPDPRRLLLQLRALEGQVDEAIVVDNASRNDALRVLEGSRLPHRVVSLPTNHGVAHGFNAGIAAAAREGATHVLLLDHDSVPMPGMVQTLRAVLDEKRSRGVKVAAAGPRICDMRDHRELPFIRLGWLRNHHMRPHGGADVIACDFLISSGTLVPFDAYRELGPFDESLFVDNVDLEWCFRARSRGYALFGVGAARLDHRLGDTRLHVGRRVRLVVHSPERLYYMTRNRFLLYRRPYMPLKWKIKDPLRVVAKFAATMMFMAPRLEYARMTWRGLSDALLRRTGKLRRQD
jgi:rhamnosyltransferase